MNYPAPIQNPACKCKSSSMMAFFCHCGHMLECHFPYTCEEAACSHLARYDFPPEEILRLEAVARAKIKNGEMPPYRLDEQGNVVVNLEPANG